MKLYFATGNSGKVEHARNILPDFFKVEQINVETIEPSIDSIEHIAKSELQQVLEKKELENSCIIADDSGLFIESLNGFPGPQTSFFDEKVGKESILKLLEDKSKEAKFRAAIALYEPKLDEIKIFTGSASGKIVEPRGSKGFGYDPLFLPKNHDKTWGEDSDYKDRNSHRQEALEKLQDYLKNNN